MAIPENRARPDMLATTGFNKGEIEALFAEACAAAGNGPDVVRLCKHCGQPLDVPTNEEEG